MFGSLRKSLAVVAIIAGASLGSYGIASAASGSSTTTTTPSIASAPSPWGQQRSAETLLTGDEFDEVTAAATAKAGSGATVVRVETDADGHAAYEAHLVQADGTPSTVYVDKSFDVVGTETR